MSTGAQSIRPAEGKLGVLLVGLGAVSSTFVAGIELIKKGLGKPIGSLTQLGTVRLGKRTDKRTPLIRDFVPLAAIDDLVFGAWDIFPDTAYQAARRAGVLEPPLLDTVRTELDALSPWPGVFDHEYVKRLDGTHIKRGGSALDMAHALQRDIEAFRAATGVSRLVMIWCASTESFLQAAPVHASLQAFESGLRDSDPLIPPSMVYAYAALSLGIPFANGAPNLTIDTPALVELAQRHRVPICGKDSRLGKR